MQRWNDDVTVLDEHRLDDQLHQYLLELIWSHVHLGTIGRLVVSTSWIWTKFWSGTGQEVGSSSKSW
jgi:hypothetical protein